MNHSFWSLETLGILLVMFIGLLVAAFCFNLMLQAVKWALWWVLRGVSRCMPVGWRVAVVRRVPWLWDKAWRERYLAQHTGL